MTEEEFEEIVYGVSVEPMYDDTYMCLKEECTEEPYAEWGWSQSLEKMIINFSYAFILFNILQYNDFEKIKNPLLQSDDEKCLIQGVYT